MRASAALSATVSLLLGLAPAKAEPLLRPAFDGEASSGPAMPPPEARSRPQARPAREAHASFAGTQMRAGEWRREGDGSSLGLRGSVDSALGTSPLVKAVDAEARAADAGVLRQQLSFLPTVTGNVGQSRLYNDTGELGSSRFSPGLRTERYGGVSVQWPIFNGFQTYFGLRSAVSTSQAARLEAEATRNDVALQIVGAYLNFISADRSVGLIGKNVLMLERLSTAVRERMGAGFSSEADVFQVEADLAGLRQQLVSMQADRDKARETVSSMAGRPVKPKAAFPRLDRLLGGGQEMLVLQAAQQNPRLRAARHNSDAARHTSSAAVGRYLPQVSMIGSYLRNLADKNPQNLDRDSWNVGVQMSVPLVNLATMADVRQSRELASAASYRADETQRQVELQIRSLWKDYTAGNVRLRLARTRAEAQRRVAVSWEEQFKLGLISLDSLLTRQRLLTTAEIEEQQADMQRYAVMCQLLVGAGVFSPGMLDL